MRGGPSAAAVGRVAARFAVMTAALVAGFVFYEFGVTSVMANRAQDGLQRDLATWVASEPVYEVRYAPTDLPPAPVVVPLGLPAVPSPAAPAVDRTIRLTSTPLPGSAVGTITIASAGVDWTFVEGVDRSSLRAGVGHMPGTALPGEPGNAVLSGHRTTHGAPFLHLDRVRPGDLVTVETASGSHVYQVVEVLVVPPTDTSVTGQWRGAWLTLTTCTPVFTARERLVVISRLVDGPNAPVILGGS